MICNTNIFDINIRLGYKYKFVKQNIYRQWENYLEKYYKNDNYYPYV